MGSSQTELPDGSLSSAIYAYVVLLQLDGYNQSGFLLIFPFGSNFVHSGPGGHPLGTFMINM